MQIRGFWNWRSVSAGNSVRLMAGCTETVKLFSQRNNVRHVNARYISISVAYS